MRNRKKELSSVKTRKQKKAVGRMIILNTALMLGGTFGGQAISANNLQSMVRPAPLNSTPLAGLNYTVPLISLSAVRQSYNIAMDLVYIYFGSDSFSSNYYQILSRIAAMPNVEVSVSILSDNLTVRFKYQLGAAIDFIDITSQTLISYPQIIKIMENDTFESWSFQQSLDEVDPQLQMNRSSMYTGQVTLGGVVGDDAIPMSVFQNRFQEISTLLFGARLLTINGRRYQGFKHAYKAGAAPKTQTTVITVDNHFSSIDYVLPTVQTLTPAQAVVVQQRNTM